jgi:hypothetical protein
MRLTRPLLGLAAVSLAAMSAAQQPSPPAQETPPPAQGQPAPGLSDLRETVQGLQDEPPPAPAPALAPAPAPAPPRTPAPAPAAAAPAPLTRAQRAALDAAVVRGRLLAAIDRAGRIATQDMLSRVSDPAGAGIAGWLAEQEGNAITVTFYAEGSGGAPRGAVYRVTILGGRVTAREVFLAGSRPPLGAHLIRMAAARDATDALDHHPCGGDAFNVLVVPPAAPDAPIDVYQISPQTQRGHYPAGGHFKSTIAPDGTVAAQRGFTNNCIDLAAPEPATGQQPAPLALTNRMDPLPTEIHVFLSVWTGHPLVVAAGDPLRLFAVTPEGIAEVPR